MWDRHRTATAGPPPPPLAARRHNRRYLAGTTGAAGTAGAAGTHLAPTRTSTSNQAAAVPPTSTRRRINVSVADADADTDPDSNHNDDNGDDASSNDAASAHSYLCQPDLDSSLNNALGIRNVTLKYRIHKGKAVRQTLYQDLPRLSQRDFTLSSAPFREPPPRNPRRLHRRLHQATTAPRPPSSVYNDDSGVQNNNTDDDNNNNSHHLQDDACLTAVPARPATRNMAQHSVQELVSPPSSPDTATWKTGPGEDNVSPIDSDVSLEEFVSKVNGPRREAPLADLSKRTNIPVKRREQALPQLPGESSLDERASSPAPALDTRRTLPSQQQQVPEPELKRAPGGDISRRQRVVSNQHKRNSIGPTQLLATDTAVGPYPYQNENVPPQSLGQRFRQAASRSKAHSIENRPPWHGASGRESVVKPMHDDVNVAPLNVPSRLKRGSGRGEGSLRNRLSHIGQSRDGSSPSAAMRKLLSSKAHKKASSMAISAPIDRYDWNSNATGAESYPSPPSESPGQTSIQPLQLPPSPTPLHMPQLNQIKRKPPPPPSTAHIDQRSSHAHPLASSPVNPDELPIRGSPEAQPLPSPPAEKADDWDQPPSRFSITTYATTAVEGTPRTDTGSGEPSPLLPTVDPSTPVMQRGRPLPRADNLSSTSNSPASASPVQSPRGEFPPVEASRAFHSPRPSSSMSTSKPLPPAPPEVSASDRVAHLTAQLNGLANRRININRCVKQMTELMPTDNVMAGEQVRQRREEEKKKVEALRTELAEVQREEYELGLMLHRAYKRQDREAQYEPTTLWVRRVAA